MSRTACLRCFSMIAGPTGVRHDSAIRSLPGSASTAAR
jgi:hypothetical protein